MYGFRSVHGVESSNGREMVVSQLRNCGLNSRKSSCFKYLLVPGNKRGTHDQLQTYIAVLACTAAN
eukprot:3126655-Amphidinium_carterae.2